MEHRHLNHTTWTLAAIDSCIGRGRDAEWIELRQAALADGMVLKRVLHVCSARLERGQHDAEFYDRPLYEEWKTWAEGVAGTR